MRIRKKSLPRCRYGGRKNRRIGRHLRQKPKKEYDNGNNDHREQRLPPARGEDREDNRLCGGIPEPGGNGAQTERGSGKPCRQGTESRPEVDDAQGGVRDAGHQPPHPATLPAEAYHSLFHDRAADTLSPAGGREPARAVDGGDTRRQDRPDDSGTSPA